MDPDYWQQKLLNLRAEVTSLEADSAESRETVELDQTKVGRLSRMDALQGQAMSNAVAARRKQQILRIDAALDRLKSDEYGYCLNCGDDIAPKRLELDPTVVTCPGCSKI